MGDLKPLGSEKLEGMDKIKRILEISRFKENIPSPINETFKNEYKVQLADGKEYQIVKEKVGYIIKKTINESTTEYIDPIKSRKYYASYSQALKRLNLMAKEMNTLFENKEGTSLFEQKKFVLKTPKPATPPPPPPQDEVENVPPPPPSDMGTPPPPPPGEDLGDEMEMGMGDQGMDTPPPPPSDEEGMGDEMEMGMDDQGMDNQEPSDEVVTFKTIQKLTGRLGQKLRTLNSDQENQMSSKDIKYVINSILSALDLNNLDEDDREQIINKFEGGEPEEDMGSEDMDMGSEDMDMGDMGSESTPPPPPSEDLGGEMKEESDDFDNVSMIADNLFMEHKVDQILFKYFNKNKNEKKFEKVLNEERKIKTTKNNKLIASEIKRLSESVLQEVEARKLMAKYPKLKFIGKSNKKNLVFENSNNDQFKITPKGDLL